LGGVWALEWAWHSAETNLRCVRSSGICTPNLNSLAPIVSENGKNMHGNAEVESSDVRFRFLSFVRSVSLLREYATPTLSPKNRFKLWRPKISC